MGVWSGGAGVGSRRLRGGGRRGALGGRGAESRGPGVGANQVWNKGGSTRRESEFIHSLQI